MKKREDADDVLGLSAAKRGAKGKGKKGAAARVADKANVCTASAWLPTHGHAYLSRLQSHVNAMQGSPGRL